MRILLALALVACNQPRSETCKSVCSKEADCVRQTSASVPFDEKECVAACSVLEADPDNKARVLKHADCVMKANQTCTGVLECE